MKQSIFTFIILVLLSVSNTYSQSTIDFDELLGKSVTSYADIKDYTCTFHKREFVRGKIREEMNVFFKFKKPQHFYMKWTEDRKKGVEAIFVEGKYDNKLVVHLAGIFSFIKVSISPEGALAMKNNRHPIYEAGIGHIIRLIEKNYLMSEKDKDTLITYEGEKDLDGKDTILIKAIFPQGKGYYGHQVFIYFDKVLFLPVKITVYGWGNEFLEEYHFENFKFNVGLTDKDFDPNNPEYNF